MKVSSRAFAVLSVIAFCFGACAADPKSGKGNKGGTAGDGTTAGIDGTGSGGISGNPTMGGAATGGTAGTGGGGTAGDGFVGSDSPVNINECPGSIAADKVMLLQDPSAMTVAPMRWLYPYENTVFPRGLESPLLQWDESSAGASEAVYIHMSSKLFDYKGCLPPTAAGQLQIPQTAWEAAGTQSRGASDPLTIELTTLAGGMASKLPNRTVQFALATLKNAVYYNTYGSALANQMGVVGGVVMRITPKQTQPDVFLKATNTAANCIGCHAVSADGSKLVAEEHAQPGLVEATGGIYDLTSGMLNPPPAVSLTRAGFSALYPDGSVYFTCGRPLAGPFGGGGNVVTGTFGPATAGDPAGYSKLISTKDGMEIPGTDGPRYALMPQFSTDGRQLVFNHLSDTGTGGHELAVMNFDKATNKFSGLKTVYTDPALFVGWPSFLPDVATTSQELAEPVGKRAIFVLGSVGDYVTQEAPAGITVHKSDLWWIDIDSGKAAPLARAGGFEGTTNFMPYGDRDAHRDFFPTASPVAAGGYFWIFFSSRRQYGNKLTYQNENDNAGKKIWVAAIDINAPAGSDPSHPAFYLPGQESESGNVRAFAALSPCHGDGDKCETGIDCCSGHCIDGVCGTPEVKKCSGLDEACETAADCCPELQLSCIGGFCGAEGPS